MIWLGAGVLIALQIHLMGAHVITSNERFPEREVLLAFVVNRHGERSPDADELSFSDQQEKIKNLTYIEGLEGLTNVGKRRAYELGKFIRERYGSKGLGLLSDIYFQEQIALRSTDKERTKMTAQMAMAAVYPPVVEQQWNKDLGKVWQPVPYTAVPLTEDYLRYYSNCQRFKDLIAAAKKESVYQEFAQYRDLIAVIKKQTGRDFTEDPSLFQTLFDLYKSQVSLGLEIPAWVKPVLPRLGEAAKLAYRLYFRNDEMKKIGGGVILNDFVNAANDIAAGKPVTKRFRMFSSHDFNIGALMEVTKVVRQEQGIPEYGALFGLELYRAKGTGEFSVVPIYLPKAGDSKVQELHFSGCDARKQCDLKRFVESTKQYLLPEKEFYEICKIRTELP